MIAGMGIFLLTPLREGRLAPLICFILPPRIISTHAPAGGATAHAPSAISMAFVFLLTPLREGRPAASAPGAPTANIFLLTPLREGRRKRDGCAMLLVVSISTHAPAGGATSGNCLLNRIRQNFYSRPCGRGDVREVGMLVRFYIVISTHAPAGGATQRLGRSLMNLWTHISTHAPAGGATFSPSPAFSRSIYFYSRPCGRGDQQFGGVSATHID